ncbi:MAG: FtsX-like permease family protein [Planctomycetes bacterium]|nr:FtsX-like permease family protein [Planctomycetota bacterium]
MIPAGLIGAHLRRNRLRAALTAGSVALAVFLFCTLQTVITSLQAITSGHSANRLIASSAVSLFQTLPLASVERIRSARLPDVLEVGHWTWFDGIFRGDPREFFARFAVDVRQMRRQYGDLAPGGGEYLLTRAEWDRFEQERSACIVGRGLADRYGLRVGDPLVLEGTIYPGTFRFTIVAVYSSGNPTYDEETLFFHWDYLNEAMGRIDTVGTMSITIRNPYRAAEVCLEIDALFQNSANRTLTQPEAAFNAQFLSMWGRIDLLFAVIGGAVVFASFMITLNTMLLSVKERVREIGVLKTLGFPNPSLFGLYLAESALLCGGGAVLGLGLAMAAFHGQPVRLATVIFPEFGVAGSTQVAALLIGALLALISGVGPGLVAARVPIVKALRLV